MLIDVKWVQELRLIRGAWNANASLAGQGVAIVARMAP
jgi:hypothetical protein